MKEFTKTQAEDIYELVDRRHRTNSLIVTANRAPKDWYPLFPNPVIAESTLDRLISGAHMITLTGKSYRSMLRPNKDLAAEWLLCDTLFQVHQGWHITMRKWVAH